MTISYTPINIPGVTFYDRRVAASDEYRTRDRRAIYRQDIRRGPVDADHPRGPVLPVPARRGYDVRTSSLRARNLNTIRRVFLHQTGPIPAPPSIASSPGLDLREDNHRLDVIIAHLIVRRTGEILYTHDFQLVLNGTGGLRDSIEIEFEGSFNTQEVHTEQQVQAQIDRVGSIQLRAGRLLLQWLNSLAEIPIQTIHPHQQYSPRTRPNCPGPDIWVNVGEWATRRFNWGTLARGGRQISDRISNQLYSQIL